MYILASSPGSPLVRAYVDSLTFAPVENKTFTQVQRSTNNYACVEEGEPGDEAMKILQIYKKIKIKCSALGWHHALKAKPS